MGGLFVFVGQFCLVLRGRNDRNMHLAISLLIGAIIGALNGISIFFVKEEHYKIEVFLATTLRNAMVGQLVFYALDLNDQWWYSLVYGGSFGFVLGLVVFLATGGFKTRHQLVILPLSLFTGMLTGILVWWLGK